MIRITSHMPITTILRGASIKIKMLLMFHILDKLQQPEQEIRDPKRGLFLKK